MSDVLTPVRIDPDGIYHEGPARLLLGLTEAAIRQARLEGALRNFRQGRVVLYRGQWLLDWLNTSSEGCQ